MLLMIQFSGTARPEAERVLPCIAIVAALVALLFASFFINFDGLARLLPDGERFSPYYTT